MTRYSFGPPDYVVTGSAGHTRLHSPAGDMDRQNCPSSVARVSEAAARLHLHSPKQPPHSAALPVRLQKPASPRPASGRDPRDGRAPASSPDAGSHLALRTSQSPRSTQPSFMGQASPVQTWVVWTGCPASQLRDYLLVTAQQPPFELMSLGC